MIIEEELREYLSTALNDVQVVLEVAGDESSQFVRIERTGGREENFLKHSTFAVQSYASSMKKAAELNEEVKKAMNNIVILDRVCKSTLNSDYNFTDTRRKKYRYQAVYDLTHY